LLDRVATAAGKAQGSSTYAATDGETRDRVGHIEKVLNVLGALPAGEPARDLVARTLKFVEASSGQQVGAAHSRPQPYNSAAQPPLA
jgi:hypothetical protein